MAKMIHEVLELLGVDSIKGNPQQLAQLCTWIDDLAKTNGRDWVRNNREVLVKQWEDVVDRNSYRKHDTR